MPVQSRVSEYQEKRERGKLRPLRRSLGLDYPTSLPRAMEFYDDFVNKIQSAPEWPQDKEQVSDGHQGPNGLLLGWLVLAADARYLARRF